MPAPLIKICGLSTPESLDAALAARADFIGLVFFAKSPRNVAIGQATALARRAAGKAQVVGLFVDPDLALLEAVSASVPLDAIQLHGNEMPAFARQVRATTGCAVWKALGVRKRADLEAARAYAGAADRVLYDAKPPKGAELPGGTGLRIDWDLMKGWQHPVPWMLAGGLDPRNVAEAVQTTSAPAVDVSSGVESAPGIKDIGKIADFCAALHRS